jgi:hypothetical protein
VHELEHHAAQLALRERAARVAVQAFGFDERDASLAQRVHRREHVGRAEADAVQRLLRLHVEDAGLGLDQLQAEAAVGAAQDAALGQDAVALLVGQRHEAEELAIELGPILHRSLPMYCTTPNQRMPVSVGGAGRRSESA